MIAKHAQILTNKQIKMIHTSLRNGRTPERNSVMFLLSVRAGLRAGEISKIRWAEVLNGEGEIHDVISLHDKSTKGGTGGRIIPINKELKLALETLWELRREISAPEDNIVYGMRNKPMSANSVTVWFHRLYSSNGFVGCSSHSGRRTFITNAARKISTVNGSLRDVQLMCGHSSLSNTMRYIEGNENAQKLVVDLI